MQNDDTDEIKVEQNDISLEPPNTTQATEAPQPKTAIYTNDQAEGAMGSGSAMDQEDLLKDKLMEVGSVQHQEDDPDGEPTRIQSDLRDLQNNTVGANMSSANPSSQQFELIKNQSHTHDYNFFSGASAQLLQKGSE